jgi:hypothetical protein
MPAVSNISTYDAQISGNIKGWEEYHIAGTSSVLLRSSYY